jgi:ankyrin repeat protein
MLLDADADQNVRDFNGGFTPLILATIEGHAEIVRLLLEAGADYTIEDTEGRTALSIALNKKTQK